MMRKSLKYSLLSVALILCVVLGVKGYILQVPSGTWAAQPSLAQARSGASAVLLQDGRILVTGGYGAAGTLASAEIIGVDGTSSAATSMSTARSKHIAAVLANGSVLVAGGTNSVGGAINTAEIYDPVANSWTTLAATMVEARSNATATVLQDGRVLIAGGDRSGVASSTIEIFDPAPAALTFSFAGALASPRTDHAMALLSDGRVFIAGGSNGSVALKTTDIYDPVIHSVNAGPALSALRMGHSATTMLDGRVLIAGGNNGTADLATAEIFDPVAGTMTAVSSLTTARQGHLAFLLPNNNTVLIVGGTSAGVPLASAEVFTPWLGTFAPTGSLTAARSNSAGSPMKQDGLLVVAGGQDASGVALANTDIYGFATVKTDAADYPPGTTVNISGSGWQPGETVTLTLVESPLIDTHGPFTVVADSNGSISNSSFVTDLHDINVRFSLTAVGSISQAQNTFTDAQPPDDTSTSVTCSPSSVGINSSTTCTAKVTDTKNGNNNGSPLGSIGFTQTGVTGNFSSSTCTLTANTGSNPPTSSCAVTFTPTAAGTALIGGTYTSSIQTTWANSSTTQSFTVTAFGAATKLALSGATSNLASGATRVLTATIQDAGGNTVTAGADSTLSVTFAKTAGAGSVTGLGSSTAVAGVATLTVTGNLAGSVEITATATASGGALTTGTGNPITFTVVTGTATKLAVSGATTNLASGTTRVLTATIQDANGNTVTTGADSTLSVTFAQTAGAGSVTGLGSSTAAAGVATLTVTGNVAGSVTITATATGSAGALTAGTGNPITFTVVTGTATKLALSGATTNLASGTTRVLTATIQDAGGNTVTTGADSTLSVTFAQTAGAGSVTGLGSSTAVVGVATLTVTGNLAGSVTITATATGSGGTLTPGTGNPITFTVNPGTVTQFVFSTISSPQIAGTAFNISITAEDANNNTDTTYDGNGDKVMLTSTGALVGAPITSPSFTKGVLSIGVTINNTGSFTITAIATGNSGIKGTSKGFTVNPAAVSATTSTVSASPASVTADGVTASTITVTLKDAFGNLVSNKTVSLTASGGSSNISTASGLSNANGVVTFTVTDTKAEAVTYTAKDATDNTTITPTASVTFTAGAPVAGNSTISGTGPITANGTSTSAITITLKDTNGNPVSGVTPTFAATGSNNIYGACSSSTAGVSNCTLASTTAEIKTLSLLTPVAVTGGTVTFTAGALATLSISPANTTITAGGSQAYTATGVDSHGNSLGDLTASTAFSIAPDGSCTFATCTASKIGLHTVTGTNSGQTTTASLQVSAGAITSLLLTPQTMTIAAGASQTYAAQGFDSFNNPAGDVTAGTTFTITPDGSCTGAACTASIAGSHAVTGTYTSNVKGGATLMVSAGTFTKLQVLVPGETAAPGTTNGKTGTPNIEYVNGAFNATVNAVDDNWNVVSSVTDTVSIASSDTLAVLPADAPLVAGTGTFSVKLETPENTPTTTITVSDTTPANSGTITPSTSGAMEVIVAYTARIIPATAANAVQTTYTLTVNNAAAPNLNILKSVTVAIPANGGMPTVASNSPNATPANWMVDPTPVQGFLRFRECVSGDNCYTPGSNNDVAPGGSITIQFTTTASETINNAAVNEVWTTTAFSDTAYTTALPLAGAEPTVAIGAGAAFTSADSTTFANNTAGTFTVRTTGFPTPTLAMTSGSLPHGVTFTDKGDGTATIAGTTQVAGDYAITITAHNGYGADATQTFTLTVTKANTTTAVMSSNLSSFSGQPVTFTATVVPGNSTAPTGTVQFQDGGVNLGSAVALTSSGSVYSAQLQTSSLSVGTHSITAIYSGDTNFFTSTSAAISQVVKSAVTITSISAPWITYGADGVVTVTVAAQDSAAGTPTGNVTLTVDTGVAVSQALVNGSATFTISKPGAGDHKLCANFAAQNNFLASTATGTLTVKTVAITVTADPQTKMYGSPDPSPLTYQVTGTLVSGDVFSGALVRAPGTDVGTYAITQGSLTLSANYTLAFVGASFTITPATPAVAATGGTFAYSGNAETGTGAAMGVLGEVLPVTLTYFDASNTALPSAPVNAGNYTVVAVYSGSLNYKATLSSPAAIVITAIPLFIEANYKTRAANAPDPPFDATYVGLINGETPQSPSLSGMLTCTSTASLNSPGGRYVVNCSGVTSADYNITYVPGVLVITNPIISIAVNPTNPSVPVFSSQAFTATGTFADGTSRSLNSGGGAWNSVMGMTTPVSGAAVGLINGMIYVAGGSNGVAATDSTEAYNITNNTWTAKHAMLAPRSASSSSNGAVINGKLYVVGGNAGGSCSTANEVYDPASDSWSSLTALPTPKCDLAVVAANGHLYAIGGANTDGSTQVESYDPATNSWTTKASLPPGLTGFSATVVNGKIYVMGGLSSSGYTNTNEVYDPSSDSWTAKSNMPSARSELLSGAVDGVIYAIGGQDSTGPLPTVEAYNPLSDSWTTKAAVPQAIEAAGVVSANDVLYVAGISSGTPVVSLQTYTPDDISWASGTTSVSTIDSTGNAAALVPGTSTITASSLTVPAVQGNTLLTVIQATPVFSALTSPTIVYGTPSTVLSGKLTLGAHIPTGSVSITVNGVTQSAAIAGADGSFASTFTTNSFGVTGSPYTITYSYAGDVNFTTVSDATKTLTVTPASLTVTADPQTKVYGNTDPALTYKITSGSLFNGDTFTGALARAAGENVGTYAIGQGSLVLSANYHLTYVGANLVITVRPITVTADAQTKVYGYADPSLTYKVTGTLVTGDSFTGGLSRAAGENVGTYAIGQGSLVLSANYNLSYVGANLVITVRPITVTADAQTKVYGYADPSLTYKVTGTLVTGDNFSGGLSRTSGENVGTYAIGQGNLALSTNYSLTFVGANLVITARPITVTADAQTKMYGNNDPALTYKVTMGTLVTGDSFTGTLSRAAGNSVGTYAITQGTLALSGNYGLTYAGAIFTITPAPLVITASSGTMIYGGPVFPVTPFSYNAFVNGDTSTSLSAGASCGTQATSASLVGTYTSFCAGAVDPNYTITYINGVVTITPAGSTTTVSSSLNTSNWGQVVIFTATVTPQFSGTPTGSVSFYNAPSGATCQSLAAANAATLDVEPLATVGSSQQVSTSTAWLPVGTDTVLACYSGDGNFIGGNGTVSQTVIAAPIAKLDPPSLSFGNQQGGTISGPQTVNISNPNGTAPLLIFSIKLAGTNPGYFTESDTCSSVAVGASCIITVKFAPPANTTGVATANVVVTDNDENVNGSTQTSLLTGAGISSINSVGSLSTFGVFATANGCSSINMSGNALVDSINSGANNNSGNVGTNGNASLSGNPVINGAVYSPIGGTGNCSSKSLTGLSLSGKAQAIGGLQALSKPLVYPAPPASNPAPPTTSQNISGSCGAVAGCSSGGTKVVFLAPGQYGNVSITGGTSAHFSAGGAYNFNSLTLSGNSILVVDAGSGPVVVNLAGKSITGGNAVLDLTGGVMSNASGQASNLQFYYAGSQPVKLSGNTASYAVVYAPNAPVNLSGGSHFYGAVTGSTVNNSGGTAIHYDANLPNIPAGDYVWFNSAALNVQGIPASGSVKIYVTNASISFPSTSSQCTAPGTFNATSMQCTLPVPNAVLTFSSMATTASTTWDATNSRWTTLVPTNGSTSVQTHSFIDGLAYMVPAAFPAGIQNVTWSAAFSTSTPGISFSWQWGAAIYSSFSSSYPSLGVNPVDNADPAGTPENYKSSLVFGATGPGYVGLYTGAAGVVPTIAEASVSPSSLDFTNGGTVAQTVGTTSAPLQAVLTNNMSGSLTISSVQLTGTNLNDFALLTTGVNSCLPLSALPVPGSLPSGASCTLYVTFMPSAIGKRTAKIVVNDNANNTPQTVFVKGTGQ
jgi:N-acetylneuraminic acid mutarotase